MYLISYDIAGDKLRNKVAKKLEGYGHRVQYSVFECDISNKEYGKLYAELIKLVMKEPEVSIRIYPLDKDVYSKLTIIGNPEFSLIHKIPEDNVIFI